MFIIGIVFIGVGFVFRLFGWSMNLMGDKEVVSKSEVREIVKEEISKKKVSKSKKKRKK